jgi:hypothetical protein
VDPRSGVAATVIALTACSGGASQPPLGSPPVALTSVADATTIARPDRGSSWMARSPETSQSLLYISDEGTFDVYVYSFPALKRVGTLTGFSQPQGDCVDRNGNVWIASTQVHQILEFAHGGKSAIHILVDPTGYPVGCAIDPTTGNLAVTNFFDFSGAGSVMIYRKARGTPTPYANPKAYYYYFAGYDPKGNLYVSGRTGGNSYILSVLPHGKTSMATVSISGGSIQFPGTVQWAGSSLVLGDQKCDRIKSSCFYRTDVSGTVARIVGTTRLTGSCDVVQAWIQNAQLAAGNYAACGGHASSTTDVWPFPAGGKATKSVRGVTAPVGATISN